MAEQEQKSEDPGSNKQGVSGKLIGRLVVYGVLAILIIVGLLDYRIKAAANKTGVAWRDAQNQASANNEDLLQSQLQQYIQGSPKSEPRDAKRMDGKPVRSIVTYSWSGIIRNYNIYVGIGLGEDPSVEAIRGPGDTDPLAKEQ